MNEILPRENKREIGRTYTDEDNELVDNALTTLQTYFDFISPESVGISVILTPDEMPHEAVINRIANDWECSSTEDCKRKAFIFNAEEMFYPSELGPQGCAEPYSTLQRAASTLRQQHRKIYNLRDGQSNSQVNGTLMIIDIPHPSAYRAEMPPAELREFFVRCSSETLAGNLQGVQNPNHDNVQVVVVAPSEFTEVAAEDDSLWYCLNSNYGGVGITPMEYVRQASITTTS